MSKPDYRYLGPLQEALADVCELFEFGRKKYPNRKWDATRDVPKFRADRVQSMLRHAMHVAEQMDSLDEETHIYNLAAVAWNALVVLQLGYNERKQALDNYHNSSEGIIEEHNKSIEHVWVNPEGAPYPYGRHTMPINKEE